MKKTESSLRLGALLLAGMLAMSGCAPKEETENKEAADTQEIRTGGDNGETSTDSSEKNELTALEAVRLMGNGINLGNTMEAFNHSGYVGGSDPTSFETLWGQPVTTKEMIDGMKAAGFDTIRIPVAWTNGMNYEKDDYTIDERLMNRVDTIVKWALDADMYVIVNDHWDGSWWGMFGSEDEATREKALEMYKAMWDQITDRFVDYSYKLIFESANEELGDRLNDKDVAKDSGSLTESQCYETAHMINSEFVKLVRSKGGKNADRFLLIAGYNTDITKTCDPRYKMPEDTADSKLMISVHYYTPWDYCGTDSVNQWGSPTHYEEQNKYLGMMKKFTDEGYGVVIGEYAVMSSKKEQKPDSDRFYNNFLDNCDYYNYCPVLWDCNDLYKRLQGSIGEELYAQLYLDRSFTAQSSLTDEQVRENAKNNMDAAAKEAEERMFENMSIPASDDKAIAWIMFNSSDYAMSYSVGDVYDPTNMTQGVIANNVEVTGEGIYTVSLDFSGAGTANGVAFSALGISNGEVLFPDYVATIDKIEINGEEVALEGKGYTSSDNSICTRVNLFNGWVSKIPDSARTADGSTEGLSAQILNADGKKIKTISVTFTYTAP